MPEAAPAGEAPRLRSAFGLHVSRSQLVVGILLATLGFAAVVQVRSTHADSDYAGARRQDLVLLLSSVESAAQRTQTEIADLERTRRALENSSHRTQIAVLSAKRELQVLGVLAGTVPVVGPGVRITIDDPSGSVGAASLLNAMEELRDAGAEAIEINGSVRVVAQTALVDASPGVRVGGTVVRPPYVIEAIGAPHTLAEAVVFPGGMQAEVKALGGSVAVQEEASLRIDALRSPQPAQYARRTTSTG
jgi:uncharacterized protein YlxW (UPF0749 family)